MHCDVWTLVVGSGTFSCNRYCTNEKAQHVLGFSSVPAPLAPSHPGNSANNIIRIECSSERMTYHTHKGGRGDGITGRHPVLLRPSLALHLELWICARTAHPIGWLEFLLCVPAASSRLDLGRRYRGMVVLVLAPGQTRCPSRPLQCYTCQCYMKSRSNLTTNRGFVWLRTFLRSQLPQVSTPTRMRLWGAKQ